MNRLYGNRYRCIGITGLLWGLMSAIAPLSVRADVPLTRADVESLQNNVEVILQGQSARPATLSDWLGLGDALRTSSASRAELRFNDGSLARIGERATFRFSPDTRNFRLSNGTVLLLIPPGNGPSTIQTPSAVTGVQGTALVIRHIPFTGTENSASPTSWETGQPTTDLDACNTTSQMIGAVRRGERSPTSPGCVEAISSVDGSIQEYPGRTIVMVLTNNPQGPVVVTNSNGVTQDLTAGHMAVIEGDEIQVLEFDLSLFYQTSPLVEGLHLDDPTYEGSNLPTDPVRQETLEGLATQDEFDGSYLLNPAVLNAQTQLSPTQALVVLPNQPSEVGVQTATRDPDKPIGLMSALLVNRGVVNPDSVPVGVIEPIGGTPQTTTVSNASGSSTQTPSAKDPGSYSGDDTPQVVSNPPQTHSPGSTPVTTPTTPDSTPGNSGQTPTEQPVNSGSPPVTTPSTPSGKPSPTPGVGGSEPPVTNPGNSPGSSNGQDPSIDPTPPGSANDPGPGIEPTPDPTPDPGPVIEPTPPGPANDPGPVIEPTPDPTPDPGPVIEPTPPGPANDPGPVIEPTPDPTPDPGPVIEPTPPGPANDPGPVIELTPDPTPDPGPVIEPTPPGPANDPSPVIQLTPDPAPSPEPTIELTPPGPANEPSLSPEIDPVVPNVDNPGNQVDPTLVDPTGSPTGDILPSTVEIDAIQDGQDSSNQDLP